MLCRSCHSGEHTEFTGEVMIHFRGLKNVAERSLCAWNAALHSLPSRKPN